MFFSKKRLYQNTRRIFTYPELLPPRQFCLFCQSPSHPKSTPLASNAWHSYVMQAILASQCHGGNTCACHCEARIGSLAVPVVKIAPQRPKLKIEDGKTSLGQFMSKLVFKKDPSLPSWIWDRYHPPSILGTMLLWSAAGGGLAQAADLPLCCSKNQQIHVTSGSGCSVERGGNGDDGGAREGELDWRQGGGGGWQRWWAFNGGRGFQCRQRSPTARCRRVGGGKEDDADTMASIVGGTGQ